jgi:FG-GAP-like repeat
VTITGGTIDGPGSFFAENVSIITAGPPLTLGGGVTFQNFTGSLTLSAPINIGDATGPTATIVNGATFGLISDAAGIGVNPFGNGSFQNNATLAKTGGNGTSHIAASVTSRGTVSVTTGTLEFDGPSNSLSGTISGTGTIALGAGTTQFQVNPTISNILIDGGTVSFTPTLNYFGNLVETAGLLTLSGTTPTMTGSFTLTGGALNFNAGATLTLPATTGFGGGSITGGTVALNGNTAVVGGTTVIQAAVVNNGLIAAGGGLFDLAGAVSGNGRITIGTGAISEFGQTAAATQKVIFADSTGTLQLDQPSGFKSPISGFERGDVIDAIGVTANSATYSGGTLTLRNGATTVLQLAVSTPYAQPFFGVASDQHGGTAVTVSPTATPLRPASDFNNDGISDLLFQNSSGQADIWELNGISLVLSGSPGNPGPSWHPKSTGDFNADGRADVLFQNSSGEVFIWEMNGVNIIATGSAGNPGPSWHVVGSGDFNGDHLSDILFQNSSGELVIWEMNGATVIASGDAGNPGPSWHAIGTGRLQP